MLGLRALADLPDEAARAPTYDTNPPSFSAETLGLGLSVLAQSSANTGTDPDLVRAAIFQGVAALRITSEQKADAAATTARVARILWAPRKLLLVSLSVVVDSTVQPDPADFVTFTLKKHADGAAIGSALADPLSTSDLPLTARTERSFAWSGDIVLAAGDMLVCDISKSNLGAALPKFMFTGYARSI